MGVGTPISQYEKATSIPDETLYIAEMGNGSGTKVVTQETLTKKVGEGLKIGDLSGLQTEAKNSIVDAINEAAQSDGGGSAVDILDTKEEIEANTETGKAAGAQAVKAMFGELNDNLQGFTPVIDPTTGKMTGYKTTVGGADTVFPFNGESFEIIKIDCFAGQTGVSPGYFKLTLKLIDTSKTGVKWVGSGNSGFNAGGNCSVSFDNGYYQCAVEDKSSGFTIVCSLNTNGTAIFNNIIAY